METTAVDDSGWAGDAPTMKEVEERWDGLRKKKSSKSEYPGEEFEVPNQVWHFNKMFDRRGRYFKAGGGLQDWAHDEDCFGPPGLEDMVRGIREQEPLQIHPRGKGGDFFASELPPAEEMAGWYDIVCYGSAADDGYRNGRSNEGMMKLEVNSEEGNKPKLLHGELRPSAQEFLDGYCGLRYIIEEQGRSNGEIEIDFDAPDRFTPDMEVFRTAKLRIFNERAAMRLDVEERGGHLDYGKSLPLDEAERLMRKHEQSKSTTPSPVLYFEKGDLCINSNWVYLGGIITEIVFIARKHAPNSNSGRERSTRNKRKVS